ncbi:MAG: alpha/beta fold hydrolase, partial [Anaerolineaceae bacterium]|nr:alpha/beta fold hydrolase [Anaerolineaceae bacterium]
MIVFGVYLIYFHFLIQSYYLRRNQQNRKAQALTESGTHYAVLGRLIHHCQDVLALINDLGLERPILMGHSLGAFISLAFAAQHPDRVDRLVLVDGGGKLSEIQMAKVFAGIKPSLDRLGKTFP